MTDDWISISDRPSHRYRYLEYSSFSFRNHFTFFNFFYHSVDYVVSIVSLSTLIARLVHIIMLLAVWLCIGKNHITELLACSTMSVPQQFVCSNQQTAIPVITKCCWCNTTSNTKKSFFYKIKYFPRHRIRYQPSLRQSLYCYGNKCVFSACY